MTEEILLLTGRVHGQRRDGTQRAFPDLLKLGPSPVRRKAPNQVFPEEERDAERTPVFRQPPKLFTSHELCY